MQCSAVAQCPNNLGVGSVFPTLENTYLYKVSTLENVQILQIVIVFPVLSPGQNFLFPGTGSAHSCNPLRKVNIFERQRGKGDKISWVWTCHFEGHEFGPNKVRRAGRSNRLCCASFNG